MRRILLLGGTTQASDMARALADAGMDAVFSYAGRTQTPRPQPLPTRVGGFGGAKGLARYLRTEAITHVIDATHPFASTMSTNAVEACAATHTPLLALERPPWPVAPDWQMVADIPAAMAALPQAPARVFLAIGRQHLEIFARKPQHHYLLRVVDPLDRIPFPHAQVEIGRGPFTVQGDRALMEGHGTQIVISKNAGGAGAAGKLDAARALGLRVIMVNRPHVPTRPLASSVAEAMGWLGHGTASPGERSLRGV